MKVSNEEILNAILTNQTQKAAADSLGISPVTLCNRLKTPKMRQLLTAYREKQLDTIMSRLLASSEKASKKLDNLMDSENEFVAYNSASKVLQLSNDYIVTHDIKHRLEALEEKE